MKIATTLIGLEEMLRKEAGGKIICPGRILFNKDKRLRSALIIYDLISYFKFKSEDEIYKNISKIKLKFKGSFRIDCSRQGNHIFDSQKIRKRVGEIFYNLGNKVDLKNPKNIFYVDIVNDNCLFGKNPVNAGRRDYKLRSSRDSLNPVIAFSLLNIANFKKDHVLLDPFCADGVILIEAGLLGGKKLYGLCHDIKNASINAKIAKVKINFYKEDLTWLNTLFKEDSVDLIITKPLFPSKTKSVNLVDNVIRELFYRASNILKKKGKMVFLTPKTELIQKHAKLYNFSIKEELNFKWGDLDYKILSLKKSFK